MGELLQLQNGSDIRGIAVYGVKDENVNLTITEARKIGAAFGQWIKQNLGKEDFCIGLGRDTRISGDELKEGIIEGLNMAGAKVFDFGYASTPSMFMCTQDDEYKCDGAVMITGSHLPYNRNGMKLFTKLGALNQAEVTRILEMAEKIDDEGIDISSVRKDFVTKYAQSLVNIIRDKTQTEKPFANARIIVDAGNGVGGFFVDKLLRPLGADTAGSMYLEHNGMFPHHVPDPDLPGVLEQFRNTLLDYRADLGILFDTDADRAAVIDGNGKLINKERMAALMSAIVLAENPGTVIVTDSVTSDGLRDFIEKRGGKQHRFKRGYKAVIEECKRLNNEGINSALAIETSGHCALRENHYLDDGAYMIVKLLIEFTKLKSKGQSLSDLIADLHEPAEEYEFRVKISGKDYKETGAKVIKEFEQYILNLDGIELVKPSYEGVRLNLNPERGNGWCLMRMSLHDPKLVVNIQSEETGGMQKIKGIIIDFLGKYKELSM